jgi:putative transposase
MPRSGRIVLPNVPHHITHKGNNAQRVFITEADRVSYLDILRFQCRKHNLKILGYCLMQNHVHLVVIPEHEISLALAIGRAHGRYSQRFNLMHSCQGHLWQNRFYSCALNDSHLLHALRYVDRNPVRAGIVEVAVDYQWSSAKAHVEHFDEYRILDFDTWKRIIDNLDWMAFVAEIDAQKEVDLIRYHTYSGKPMED